MAYVKRSEIVFEQLNNVTFRVTVYTEGVISPTTKCNIIFPESFSVVIEVIGTFGLVLSSCP